MRELPKHKKKLKIEGNKVISYVTHVATIDEPAGKLYRHGHWSKTTASHITFVAKHYGLEIEDRDLEEEEKDDSPLAQHQKAVSGVCLIGQLLCNTDEEKNAWDKRMIATLPGIDFPEDWDQLSESEKKRRLEGAKEQIK